MMDRHCVSTCASISTCNRINRNEDFSLNVFSVTPYPPTRPDVEVSDGDKAGATLLFSGIFLGLVGITFTVMGWINFDTSESFEWTQLLGPILLSVGVTFVLIGVCKFKILICQICKHCDDRSPDAEPVQSGQSIVFTGINQPITFHGATVVQYIPPSYASVTRDGGAAISTQSRDIMPGVSTMTCPPQYGSLFPLDNPSFTGDDHSTSRLAMDNGNCRSHEDEERPAGKETAVETLAVSAPPSYDDIFPLPLSDGYT